MYKLLKEYIKRELKFLISEAEKKESGNSIKSKARISIIINKFPSIKKPLIKLLSPSFIYYIKDLRIQAPRPTTFLVTLINGLDFELIYGDKSFTSKISGKKYCMQNLEESERATQAVADLLSLSPMVEEEEIKDKDRESELSNDLGLLSGGGGGFGSGGESIADIDISDNNTENLPELQPEDIPGVSNSNVNTTPGEGTDLNLDF